MQAQGQEFHPRWFALRDVRPGQERGADAWLGTALVRLPGEGPPSAWRFTGEYWAAKAAGAWADCPDLYS